MRTFLRTSAFISFSILFSHIVPAQDIDKNISAYADQYRPERIYLHYDKPAYTAGETIWFKAYMMSEIIPADESKTLYTDWSDEQGNILQHTVSPLVDAVTNGQFDIPSGYKGKYIQVRAYTKWMLNFDSAFLYNKTIRILSPETTASSNSIPVVPGISFFPEGGDAIAGISNKIAFKANDQWGRPVRVKGAVLNGDGRIIDSLRTQHDGMGYFYLIPDEGASYTVKWKDEKNVEHTSSLPPIKKEGVALQLTVMGSNRFFDVRYTPGIASAMDSLYIMGTMYQREAFRIAKATTGPVKGTIPTGSLPSGILTITVFDKHWQPLAERITYVNNGEYLFHPEMEVEHWGLNKRARNEIKITVPDSLVADLSISVTDAAASADSSSNIISHLLLSSELRGEVYNPAYYFSSNSDVVAKHLDLVMLTHGWRRFKWEEVLAGKIPKPRFARDTAYLSLSGQIYGVLPGQISPGATIIMILKQKSKEGNLVVIPVNPDGSFRDPSVILFDTAHAYYQFPKSKGLRDASVQFMTDRLPAPSKITTGIDNYYRWPDTTGFYHQWLLANEANEMAERMKVKTLENVIVKSKTKSPVQLLDEKYTSGLFIGDGIQFDLINDPFANSSMNIFTYLQGKVAGLQVNTSTSPPSLQWRGGTPQLYLDEVATDPDFVSSVNLSDVAYIKVFRPPFMGGFNGANGAIAIYTRRGDDVKPEPGKGLMNNKVFGYTIIKEFYSPNYSSFSPRNEERDLRTTLYWNPTVITTPQKREVMLTFYNNDVTKSFRVVIEGMTRDGRLAHVEQLME